MSQYIPGLQVTALYFFAIALVLYWALKDKGEEDG